MSHLGFKILYKILNDDPRTLAERAYAPWVDMEARAPRRAACRSCRCESARPLLRLRRRRLLAPVRAHVHERPRACSTSAASRCAPTRSRRGRSARHRRRPDGDAPRAARAVHRRLRHRRRRGAHDRGRARLDATLEAQRRAARRAPPRARQARAASTSRRSTRRAVDADTGLRRRRSRRSSPRRRFPVVRTLVDDLNAFPFPDDGPVGGPEAIFDRMSIEIARGCTEGCRFCQAGMIYRPVRERDPEQIVETVVQRREEERLRRGEPHVALDRRLLVHRAARQEGGRRARAGEGVARRLVPARLRPRRERARRHAARARDAASPSRPRRAPADARRRQQERHRRAAHARRPSACSRAAGRR